MADQNNAAAVLAPVAAFQAAQNESKIDFSVDRDTVVDAAVMPLEMAYQTQLKAQSARVKSLEAVDAAAKKDYQDELAKKDDADVKARVAAAEAAVKTLRSNIVEIAKGSGLKVGEAKVELGEFKNDEAKGLRTFSLAAQVPFSGAVDEEAAGEAAKAAGVKGIGGDIRLTVVLPFTSEQIRLRDAARAASDELQRERERLLATRKEMDEVLQRTTKLARLKFAQVALDSTPGCGDLVSKVYDQTFFANLSNGIQHLDTGALLASGLMPGAAQASNFALPAPAPAETPAPAAKAAKSSKKS